MSAVDVLLASLDGVRKSGKGWIARCPAHDDRSASLSIAEGDDGRTLVHCFAGCGVADVVGAVGLSLSDLFPERVRDLSPLGRMQRREAARAANVITASAVLSRESAVVAAAAHAVAEGALLDSDDLTRLAIALDRIEHCRMELAA